LAAGALASVVSTKAGVEQVAQAQASCRAEGVICEGGSQVCCAGLVCNGSENPTRCRLCGALGQLCCTNGVCNTGFTCVNGTCQAAAGGGGGGAGGGGAAFRCTTNAECSARNGSVAPFCNVNTGVCVALQGLNCKSGQTPQQCCNRSVRKGCKGKQQSSKHRRNCLQRGKKRCKRLLAGIAA
jgi:hypothetical protein